MFDDCCIRYFTSLLSAAYWRNRSTASTLWSGADQAVQQELADERSPAIVQAWISQPSEWLVIQTLNIPSDSDLDNLDPGERAAIISCSYRSKLVVLSMIWDDRLLCLVS